MLSSAMLHQVARMDRRLTYLLSWAVLFAALLGSSLHGAQLVRAPYLQTATPESIIVCWRTAEPTESVVYYGKSSASLPFIAADSQSSTQHMVRISDLEPDTKYFYAVGTLTETLVSGPDYYFVTHPVPGTARPTRVWVIGDAGTTGVGGFNQGRVRDAYYQFSAARHTDVWLALGDNAYYNGTDQEYQASFFNVYEALLRRTPVWSTLGNHETYGPDVNGRIAYHDIFSFPSAGEAGGVASGTENYYSFDHANIHFVCLDSELSDRTPSGPMLSWLEEDLSANTNEWLVAFWHSPPYSKGSHDSDSPWDNFGNMTDMRTNAVRLLEAHGVDLVMCGHSHIYERSHLIHGHYGLSTTLTPAMVKDAGSGRPDDTGAYRKGGTSAHEGAVYIVAGSSGWATQRTGRHPVMYFDELQTGSVVLDFDNRRLDVKFLRETGAIDDYFTILKGEGPDSLRFVAFQLSSDRTVARWKSVAGREYRLEGSSSLHPPMWVPLTDRIVATGATTSWTNNAAAGGGQLFFRVSDVTE